MINRRDLMLGAAALSAAPTVINAQTADKPYEARTFAKDLEQPWGMAFLPDGRLLVTEKAGQLKIISADGKLTQVVGGVPKVVDMGQGGLLDVSVAPDFAKNNLVYLSFSEADNTGKSGTAVARGKLEGNSLTGVTVIWRQSPKVSSPNHWGSRLAWGKDGNLFITTGDRAGFRDLAQNLSTTVGKVIRIRPDGTIPADNPFVGHADAKPEIWSYGHRNVQGAMVHPETGDLWTNEHGPQGGDEINITQAGKNYGWPTITYGKEYSGGAIGSTSKAGLEQPLHYWVPSIAPSGMVLYTGKHKAWQGKLFVGSLKFSYLNMITLSGNKVVAETRMLEEFEERIRDVAQGPDGALYVAFDNGDGQIMRVTPK